MFLTSDNIQRAHCLKTSKRTNASDAHIAGGVSAFISKQTMKLNSENCQKRQVSIMNVNFSNNLFKVVTKSLCTRIMFYNMNNFSSFEISNIKYEGEIAKILRMHSLQTFKGGIEHVIFIHLLRIGTILCPSGTHGAFEQSVKTFQPFHKCHRAV